MERVLLITACSFEATGFVNFECIKRLPELGIGFYLFIWGQSREGSCSGN